MLPPSGSASLWAALLPAALAGTRRHPFAPLPGFIPSLGSEADAPEKQLLLTAAGLRLVQRAGRRSLPGPAENLGRAPAETGPALPRPAAALAAEVLASQSWRAAQWNCLNALSEPNRRLPAGTLASLVRRYSPNVLQQLPVGLLGERGIWLQVLAQQPDNWLAARARPLTTGWWEVEPDQRYHNLISVLHHPSAEHWTWLLTELRAGSPEQQGELLGILRYWPRTAAYPVPADVLPVLDSLLDTTQSREAASLLITLPGNPLTERYWQRSQQLLTYQPEDAHLTYQLPTAWDPAAERDFLATQWVRPQSYTAPDVARNVLHWTPPDRWLEHLGLSAAEVVALAAASPQATAILTGWVAAIRRYRTPGFARALLAAFVAQPALLRALYLPGQLSELWGLLDTLPLAEQLAWLTAQLSGPAQAIVEGPARPGNPPLLWPVWLAYGLHWHLLALAELLLPLLQAVLTSAAVDLDAARLLDGALLRLHEPVALPLLPRLETELLPLARARPDLLPARTLTDALGNLRYLHDFRARLAALLPAA